MIHTTENKTLNISKMKAICTDEAITEDILANDYEFLSNGKKF